MFLLRRSKRLCKKNVEFERKFRRNDDGGTLRFWNLFQTLEFNMTFLLRRSKRLVEKNVDFERKFRKETTDYLRFGIYSNNEY